MGILEYIDENRRQKKYTQNVTDAQEMFNKQKEAIKNIKDTAGLKEIIRYWETQKELNENMFEQGKDKEKYFALYKEAKMFLKFIANLLD